MPTAQLPKVEVHNMEDILEVVRRAQAQVAHSGCFGCCRCHCRGLCDSSVCVCVFLGSRLYPVSTFQSLTKFAQIFMATISPALKQGAAINCSDQFMQFRVLQCSDVQGQEFG